MQKELTGFVLGFTSNLGPEALGLTLYIHVVIVDAFRRSGIKLRRIRPGRIERTWAENGPFVQTLQIAGFGQSPFQVPSELSSEPAILAHGGVRFAQSLVRKPHAAQQRLPADAPTTGHR
jgi:hypothetical protein